MRAEWRRRVASDSKTRILMAIAPIYLPHLKIKSGYVITRSPAAPREICSAQKNEPRQYSSRVSFLHFVMLKYRKKLPFCDSSCLYNPTRLIEVMLGLMILVERNANLELYINSVGVFLCVSIHLIFSHSHLWIKCKRRWDKWSVGSHSSFWH